MLVCQQLSSKERAITHKRGIVRKEAGAFVMLHQLDDFQSAVDACGPHDRVRPLYRGEQSKAVAGVLTGGLLGTVCAVRNFLDV